MEASTLIALRLGIGIVCLWSGVIKARSPQAFARSIASYRILPARTTIESAASVVIIACELGVGLLLITGLSPRPAAILATGLFSTFAAAIAINLARENRIPCHCFGSLADEPLSWATLLRAVALLAGSVTAFALSSGVQQELAPEGLIVSLTGAAAVVIGSLLIGLLPQAWSYLTVPAVVYPSLEHRRSFKQDPLDGSLRIEAAGDGHGSDSAGRRDTAGAIRLL